MNELARKTFIEKAKKIHGDKYDYSKVNYIKNDIKVKGIGALADTVKNALSGDENAKKQLSEMTYNPWLGPVLGNSIVQNAGQEAINEKTRSLANEYGGSGAEASRIVGNIAGSATVFAGGSAAGSALGPALGTTASVGSKLGTIGASGLSSGARTATYTDNMTDIALDALKGAATTATFIGTASALKSAFPISSSIPFNSAKGQLVNFGRNALVGTSSAYTSTTVNKLLDNVKNVVKGNDVTGEDWLSAFASSDHALSMLISAPAYGIQGSLADQTLVKNFINTMHSLEDAENRAVIQMNNQIQAGDINGAYKTWTDAKSVINAVRSMDFKGLDVDTTYFDNMVNKIDSIASTLLEGHPYASPNTPAVMNNAPSTAYNGTIMGQTASAIPNIAPGLSSYVTANSSAATPAVVNNVDNTSMASYNNVKEMPNTTSMIKNTNDIVSKEEINNGQQKDNVRGMVQTGRPGETELSDESINDTFEKIIPSEQRTREAREEIEPLIIHDVTPEEAAYIQKWSEVTGIPYKMANLDTFREGQYGGMASANDIIIDRNAANKWGFDYIAAHESGENLLLNHSDIAGKEISRIVGNLKRIDETDKTNRVVTKLFNNFFKGGKPKDQQDYFAEIQKFIKEMVFNAYGAEKELGPNNEYRSIMGDEIYNDIISTIDNLIVESAGKPRKYMASLSASMTPKTKSTSIPTFEKNNNIPKKNLTVEKQNKDVAKLEKANNELRDELAKEKEKSKAKTLRKNQEKKDAVKAEKEKSKAKIGALKAKQKEQIQDVRLRAKATTTDKKMRLAGKRLEKALNKAYDKPAGKEFDEAMNLVQKSTRGAIKLINNVKNKLPSNYSHFADDVKDIVDTIYTGGNTMTDEKRIKLEKKAEAIRKFMNEHPEYPVSQRAMDLLKEPSKRNISDLSNAELVSMAEDVAEIGIAIRDMFSFSRASEDAMKLRDDAIKYAKELRATGKTRSSDNLPKLKLSYNATEMARNYIDKRSTIKTMVLRLAGGNPNSPFKFINEQLMNGYERYNEATEKMLKVWDKFAKVTKLGNIRVINNKLNHLFNPTNYLDVELTTTSGKTYKPSVRDAISVVLGVKDPQFAGHTTGVLTDQFDEQGKPLMSSGGIARFSNKIDAKYGNQSIGLKRGVNVKLTMDDVDKMKTELDKLPYVKELMEAFKEFSDLTYQLTNDSYEAINGMSLEKRDYYFPIKSDPATRVRQKASDKLKEYSGVDASTTLLNATMVKPVVQGANNQILIYPIDEVIGKMLGDTAMYSGYATALYDINTFLSGRTEDGETLVQLIDDIDPKFLANYNRITSSIIGKTDHPNRSAIASRYTTSILKANPWLALKQAGSYFTVAKYYDHPFRSMVAGAFFKKNIAKTIREYYKEQGTDLSKLNTDQVLRYMWNDKVNAELDTRARGWNLATQAQLLKYSGILKRINTLDFYKGVDYSTVRAIAFAMVYDTILSGNSEFGDDKYFTELENKFMQAHPETQPNSSGVTRAPIQSGGWLDMALSYMADPRIKNLNMLMDARLENKYYKTHGTKEEKQRAKRNYAQAIAGTLGSLGFITAVARTKKLVEGKDDGKGIKGFLKDMFGNAMALSVGIEQIVGRFMDEYSFDVELPDTQALNIILGAIDDAEKLFEYIQKGKENKIPGAVSKVIGDISRFVGIPYQNLASAYDDLLSLTGSDLYWENKIKADENAYNKYKKYEDKVTDYEEFYKLYKATREKAVKDTYGKYNDANVKKAIIDNGGSVKEYFNILKRGS